MARAESIVPLHREAVETILSERFKNRVKAMPDEELGILLERLMKDDAELPVDVLTIDKSLGEAPSKVKGTISDRYAHADTNNDKYRSSSRGDSIQELESERSLEKGLPSTPYDVNEAVDNPGLERTLNEADETNALLILQDSDAAQKKRSPGTLASTYLDFIKNQMSQLYYGVKKIEFPDVHIDKFSFQPPIKKIVGTLLIASVSIALAFKLFEWKEDPNANLDDDKIKTRSVGGIKDQKKYTKSFGSEPKLVEENKTAFPILETGSNFPSFQSRQGARPYPDATDIGPSTKESNNEKILWRRKEPPSKDVIQSTSTSLGDTGGGNVLWKRKDGEYNEDFRSSAGNEINGQSAWPSSALGNSMEEIDSEDNRYDHSLGSMIGGQTPDFWRMPLDKLKSMDISESGEIDTLESTMPHNYRNNKASSLSRPKDRRFLVQDKTAALDNVEPLSFGAMAREGKPNDTLQKTTET